MHRIHRRLLILLCWCLATLAMALPALAAPLAQGGQIDLRNWDFRRQGTIALDGEWLLQRGQFTDPSASAAGSGAVPIQVPGPWNASGGADGHGTYTLDVLCNSSEGLAMLVPAQHSALRLHVNGELLYQQGEPAGDAESARPKVITRIVPLGTGQRCPLRLVVHLSNHDHASGGMIHSLRIGEERELPLARGRALALEFGLMGGFALVGLLPLAFYFVRRTDLTAIWFGLFCLSAAAYVGLSHEHALERLALDIGWAPYLTLELLAWYLGTPFLLLFMRHLFPQELSGRVVPGLALLSLLPMALVLAVPSRVYTVAVPYLQGIGLAAVGVVLLALWRAVVARRPGAATFLAGMVAYAAALVLDAVHYPQQFEWSSTPYGILAFVLAAAAAMAQRLARALSAEELRVLEQRHRVNLLVKATKAGILDWDATSNTITYSERFKEMLGYPPDADTGAWPPFYEFIHPDERDAVRSAFVAQIRDRSVRGGYRDHNAWQYRLQRADGSTIWVHAEAIALVSKSGRTLRFVCSFIDITQQREMAAQLARQNEALKENVRLREEVERIGRHDLKTPLNTIIALPRLLREKHSLPAEDEELLGIIERAGYRILNLVNLSLDLFRMEQGSYPFRPQPVDLLEVMRTVAADLRPHATTKDVAIDIRVDGLWAEAAAPIHAWAEELLCYSMLANLVKNAVEAAPEGSRVRLDLARSDPLVLRIHNAGAVPPAVRGRFFQKYATAGKSDGTGLGAYSAWLMARIQGGALVMHTSEEEGTTLELTLQRATEAQTRALRDAGPAAVRGPALRPEQLPAWRVLVVDDDEFNLLVIRRYLPTPPLEVVTAVNGRAALEAALAQPPDLVLIDLDMPVMDGLEATRRLREHQAGGRLKPFMIVMLSSHDDEATRQRARDAGCDLYLSKPVSRDVLLRTLAWAAGPHAQPFEPAPVQAAEGPDVTLDPDLLDKLPAFLASRRELLASLHEANASGDAATARRHAHRLAGSFSLYGFHWAARQCRRIEHDALPAAEVEALCAALSAHLDDVQSRTQAERV